MKTTPEALKKLYEALGGTSADVENLSLTPDLIEAIAEVAPTGGGGGGFMLVKYYSEDLGEGTQYHSVTTAKEIYDAVKEGKNVVAEVTLEGGMIARLALSGVVAQEAAGIYVIAFNAVGGTSASAPTELSTFVLTHKKNGSAADEVVEVGKGKGTLPA